MEMYLKDYYYMQSVYDNPDKQSVDFYFFDMNEDGMPELGITTANFILNIKYDEENDWFLLWKKYETTYYEVHGSRAVRYDGIGLASGLTYIFYKLNENGNEAYRVAFMVRSYFDEEMVN